MGDNKAQILLIQLDNGQLGGLFDDLDTTLQEEIALRYSIVRQTTTAAILDRLKQPDASLRAVLVVDGGFAKQKSKTLQLSLSQYAKAGGAVIMCGLFSSFVSPPDFTALAQRMELPWKMGDYHRTDFALNPAFKSVFGPQGFSNLQTSYSMKTVHLEGVPTEAKVYLPTHQSETQSMVFSAAKVDTTQCPAVWQKHGEGFVGFIGDVNNEEGSQILLLTMLSKCDL